MSEPTDKDLPNDFPEGELPDGQQLEEYLRGGTPVSQQYRQLRSAEVPAEIDHLVLRQAHEAVKARPEKSRNSRSRNWMRWSGPLALAASTVLVVSIVIESGVTEKEVMLKAPAPAAVEMRQQRELVEDDAAADVAAIEETELKPVAPEAPSQAQGSHIPDEVQARQAQRLKSTERSRDEAPSEPTFAPEPLPAPKIESARSMLEVEEPTIARNAAPVVMPTTVRPPPAPVAAPAQDEDADYDLAEVIVTGGNSRGGGQGAANAVQGAFRGEQNRVAGPRNTVPSAARPEAAAQDSAETTLRNYSDPEEWLRDIRQLRKENKQDAADREWRRFRDAFPNYVVSETDSAREVRR